MHDNCGEWVESMGVASVCRQQEVGVASGGSLCVWLECMGLVSGCCKEVYRFPHNITYPYSTFISSFFAPHPYFFVHFKNVFSLICKCTNVDIICS